MGLSRQDNKQNKMLLSQIIKEIETECDLYLIGLEEFLKALVEYFEKQELQLYYHLTDEETTQLKAILKQNLEENESFIPTEALDQWVQGFKEREERNSKELQMISNDTFSGVLASYRKLQYVMPNIYLSAQDIEVALAYLFINDIERDIFEPGNYFFKPFSIENETDIDGQIIYSGQHDLAEKIGKIDAAIKAHEVEGKITAYFPMTDHTHLQLLTCEITASKEHGIAKIEAKIEEYSPSTSNDLITREKQIIQAAIQESLSEEKAPHTIEHIQIPVQRGNTCGDLLIRNLSIKAGLSNGLEEIDPRHSEELREATEKLILRNAKVSDEKIDGAKIKQLDAMINPKDQNKTYDQTFQTQFDAVLASKYQQKLQEYYKEESQVDTKKEEEFLNEAHQETILVCKDPKNREQLKAGKIPATFFYHQEESRTPQACSASVKQDAPLQHLSSLIQTH